MREVYMLTWYNPSDGVVYFDRKAGTVATIEERLTLLEEEYVRLKNDNVELKNNNAELSNDNAALKRAIELQTIAISGLVNKTTLERLNQKYDKLFDTLIAHDEFTNHQLAELRDQYVELDGKIVGLQIEMRQRFEEQDARFTVIDTRFDQVVGLLTSLIKKPESGT